MPDIKIETNNIQKDVEKYGTISRKESQSDDFLTNPPGEANIAPTEHLPQAAPAPHHHLTALEHAHSLISQADDLPSGNGSKAPNGQDQNEETVAESRTNARVNDQSATILINFNNVSIIEFIRFISKVSGKNFVFDENDLQFNVTIILEN